ncbi:MAG: hypothetical protein HY760_03440 [Nitrospirae bacterium]|nr:hypothetical protein [Nitrospirota bacterium]
MNSDQTQKDVQSSRVAIQLHLARFQHFKGLGQWKEAMMELNRSLDAILTTLENTRQMLKNVNKRFEKKPSAEAEKESAPIREKRERIASDAVFVQYPDGRWSLVREVVAD